MKIIDLTTWPRREHFAFFRQSDLPFYNINTNVDITGLKAWTKVRNLSMNTVLIYATVRALNGVENFRYRLRGETVVVHEKLHPSFTHLKNGEDLFHLVTLDFVDELSGFDLAVRKAVEESKEYFNREMLKDRDDFVFISSLPWVSFTGTDHTLSLRKDDAIPRITWGKFFQADGKVLLPYNIQVNHVFVDGLHVGRFFETLDREIKALLATN